jgi:hypothetical protein
MDGYEESKRRFEGQKKVSVNCTRQKNGKPCPVGTKEAKTKRKRQTRDKSFVDVEMRQRHQSTGPKDRLYTVYLFHEMRCPAPL